MRRLLTILAMTAIMSSCGFNANRQEEGKSILKELAEALVNEMEQEEAEPDLQEEPAQPAAPVAKDGKWYDRDFAIAITGHTYSLSGTLDKSSDVKWYLTRIGNTVYQHTVESSGTTVDTISEFTDDGKRNARQYLNGALRKSYTDEKAIHRYVDDWLSDQEHAVLGYHPDSDYAQSTGTFSGRSCLIIETEKEENLLGIKKRTEKQYYVDSEYDFLLKVCSSGSGAGINLINVVLWEVTYFTDHPTDKDIYRK